MRYVKLIVSAIFLLTAIALLSRCSGGSSGSGSNDNYYLSNIVISDGISLSPSFKKTTFTYSATAPATASSCTVTAFGSHTSQTLQANGEDITSEEAFTVNLSDTTTTVRIRVTSGEGSYGTYILTITKNSTVSTEARLSSITVTGSSTESITPSFSPDTLSYDCYIANTVASVKVTSVSMDSAATITLDGTAINSGVASSSLAVTADSQRSISIVVTAEDGTTTKTYSLVVHRAGSLSNNAYLSSLVLSPSGDWNPTFSKATTEYSITVANSVSAVTVTPTVEDTGKATVSVNSTAVTSGSASASIALTANATTDITVAVTAQDGTPLSYTLHVFRQAALDTDAYLSVLTLDSATLSPTFNKTTLSYTATVSSDTTSVLLTATPESSKATMSVSQNDLASGEATSFALGEQGTVTTLNITVTAESGDILAYSIAITRPKSLNIYFEKPSSWSEAWIWYDSDLSTTAWNTTALKTAPGDMTLYRTESGLSWYKKELGDVSQVQFLFNDGTWSNKLQSTSGADFVATASVWIRTNGTMTTYDPITPQPPTITVTPTSASFSADTYPVSITITSSDTVTEKSYTIVLNDGTPTTTAMTSNSASIDIASGMVIGDIKKLTVTALNANGRTTTDQYIYKKVEEVVTRLGANYTSTSTSFSIWSPDSSNVTLVLDGTTYTCTKLDDANGYTQVYGVTVPGDFKLKEYSFKINGTAVCDPYGVMIKAGSTTNIVMDLNSTDPDDGWVTRPALSEREDSVIYEVHIRDFTIDSTSGVDSDKRGKYLGMVQSGTTCGTQKTGIDHLVELGVTHVQIMPMYDFATTMYNWGYDPLNYNVPEEQYASSSTDYVARIKEVKTMINELHKKGIRVIMDVVYNHTFDGTVFNNISTKYYYTDARKDFAGCGVALNCSQAMVSRFIQDSMNYWVSEYHVDGFRMDLMGIFYYSCVNDWADSLNTNNPNENILLYGEPWDGYYYDGGGVDAEHSLRVRMGTTPAMGTHHAGIFSGKYREYIKGDNDEAGKGYMFNTVPTWDAIPAGMRGSITATKSTSTLSTDYDPMFAYDPEQSVNYISAHDNFCLWDKIKYCGYDSSYGQRVDKFGMGMIFTSQGIPFMHGGDEMLRTKAYNNDYTTAKNSYNASDNYNKFDWTLKATNSAVYEYYKNMIAIRKAHPGFRMNTWDEVNSNVTTTTANSRQVVITTINSSANSDTWSKIMVIYNSGSDYTLSLSGTWKIAAQDENANVGGTSVSGTVVCKGTSVTILYQ